MNLFEIRNLTFTYPERNLPALNDVSLSVAAGEFVVLCGKSGCGKSTLLRHLKTVLTPFGERSGEVLYDGRTLGSVPQREQASRIGYVLQSADNQIVTDKVWHELAFGLESLGEKTPVIRRRVAEMASFFGIQEWYEKSVTELSGGQKQILALASVLAMQPDVLILDEPTSQLDPIAAEDFIETLKKINDEIGTTIILSEHRLEGALPRADRAVVMADGQIVCAGGVSEVGLKLKELNDPMLTAMPTPMRVYLALEDQDKGGHVPQTVRDGRVYLEGKMSGGADSQRFVRPCGAHPPLRGVAGMTTEEPLIEMKDVWFRYERDGRDIVKDLALSVYPGELVCVCGGNGTGKTTMLGVITGENKYYRGRVRVFGLDPKKSDGRTLSDAGLAVLPQDPQTLFTRPTVFDNLIDVAYACAKRRPDSIRGAAPEAAHPATAKNANHITPEEVEAEVRRVCELTDTADLMGFHPYDVSGGEQQRTGLAMALLTKPKLLLLDEPTKGMDSFFKEKFAAILHRLRADGLGVLMVSHDVEFCARYADRCALFFGGDIVSEGAPREFFSGNSFYTTAANRMARGLFPGAVTADEIIESIMQG
ncbi:MAG: ATP-binding cassette domain-containing protein [Clostridiales Family XIII bacterium]|jgi:energy-coupling factor transport system ATP-binding protein|nr:ATP-binding cassette domain-containing protein [Clostridiales Family XIII bacterium]